MKMFKFNYLLAVLLGIALFTGCKKDEDEENQKVNPVKPTVAENPQIVQLPTLLQNSSDPHALQVASYAQLINVYGSFTSIFNSIPATANGSELKSSGYSWTWSDNQGNTVWIEQYEEALQYSWKYYIKTPQLTAKKLIISATELKTGLGGNLVIYDMTGSSTVPAVTYNWTKSSSGSITASLLFNYDGDAIFFELVSNVDKSGSFKGYSGTSNSGIKFIDVTWGADGHGNWWVKDLDDNTTAQGSF